MGKATMLSTLSRDCRRKPDEEEESCLHDGQEGINKTLTSQRQGMLDGCKEAVKKAPGDYQNAISAWSEQSTKSIQGRVQDKVNVMVGFAALASITSMGVVFAWRRATRDAISDGAD